MAQRRTNGTVVLDHQASTAISGDAKVTPKYRHVAAVHSRQRASCLSQDSEVSPSFLGFRNLMVITLSKSSFVCLVRKSFTDTMFAVVVMNLRLVIENSIKVGVQPRSVRLFISLF